MVGVDPTIDEGSNAYGSEEVERRVGDKPTMVSQLGAQLGLVVQSDSDKLARRDVGSQGPCPFVWWPSASRGYVPG
ncbi:MAG: hypothetical protein ACOC9Q_02620, partial [bacterium]